MNMKRKFIGIAGAMALAGTLMVGSASAQDVSTSGSANVSLTVLCGDDNAGTTTYSIGQNPGASSTVFSEFDPSVEGASSSTTEQGALRLSMDIAPCEEAGWSFSASITDFTSEENATIPGGKFSLPGGEPNASENAMTPGGDVVPGVAGPAASVTFNSTNTTDTEGRTIWSGSAPIASHDGTTPVRGEMYVDLTGMLSGLDNTVEPGTYTAEITVTFSGDNP